MMIMQIAPLTPWAESTPWTCLVEPTSCISPTHDHSPLVHDRCAACDSPLLKGERCYLVTERKGWVCWRHIAAHPEYGR